MGGRRGGPGDNKPAADAAHRRFAAEDSDFLAFLNLWDYLAERQRELSGSAFRRLCKAEFLNYMRVREWQDLRGQLQSLARHLEIPAKSSSAERALLHRSPPARLLSPVGLKIVLALKASPGARRGGRPPPAQVPRAP